MKAQGTKKGVNLNKHRSNEVEFNKCGIVTNTIIKDIFNMENLTDIKRAKVLLKTNSKILITYHTKKFESKLKKT